MSWCKIYERLHWIKYYEINNNINILNDEQFMYCLDANETNGVSGMYYLYRYNNDYYKTIKWIDKYLKIILEIGLTCNQFPNDEYILQRDCQFIIFILEILTKFKTYLTRVHEKKDVLLLESQSIVDCISISY